MKLKSETREDAYYEVQLWSTLRDITTEPFRKRFDSWQAAYAYAKAIAVEDCSVLKFSVLRRTHDAYIYRGLWQWYRPNGIN